MLKIVDLSAWKLLKLRERWYGGWQRLENEEKLLDTRGMWAEKERQSRGLEPMAGVGWGK